MSKFTAHSGYSSIVFLLLALPLGLYIVYLFSGNIKPSATTDVKGVSTTEEVKAGMNISVSSTSNPWTLYEYGCTSIDVCTSDLFSGVNLSSISGGATDLHTILISYDEFLDEYEYMKVFVLPSISSGAYKYSVSSLGEIPSTQTYDLNGVSAVLIPMDPLKANFYTSVSFTSN